MSNLFYQKALIVNGLLSKDIEISKEDLGDAVWYAAANGCLDVLNVLLSKDIKISNKSLKKAVYFAARNNHLNTVDVLLNFLATVDKTNIKYYIGCAVIGAASVDNLEIVNQGFLIKKI